MGLKHQEILNIFADSVEFENEELAAKLRTSGKGIENFKSLFRAITKFTKALDKAVILIIDEVDKSSGNRVFMQFLAVLRNKYLAMKTNDF